MTITRRFVKCKIYFRFCSDTFRLSLLRYSGSMMPMRKLLTIWLVLWCGIPSVVAQPDAPAMTLAHMLDVSVPQRVLAVNAPNDLLASGDDNGVLTLWDARTGAAIVNFAGDGRPVNHLTFSPNGYVVAASTDTTVTVWDVAARQPILSVDNAPRTITAIAINQTGDLLVIGDAAGGLRFWHIPTSVELGLLTNYGGAVIDLAFSPIEDRIAVAGIDGTIWLYGIDENISLTVLEGHNTPVTALVFHPMGETLVSASEDTLIIWDIGDGSQRATLTAASSVTDVAFTSDGARLLTADRDSHVALWQVSSAQLLEQQSSGIGLSTIAPYAADTMLASLAIDGTIRLWELPGTVPTLVASALGGTRTSTFIADTSPRLTRQPATVPQVDIDSVAPPSNLTGPAISIPTVGINSGLTVFPLDGVSWAIDPWERAVGHLQGTSWINETGNIVLGGHSELPDGRAGIFRNLYGLQIGDPIFVLDASGNERRFIVSDIRTVSYTDLSVVYPTSQTRLTLITCDIPSFQPQANFYADRLVVIAIPA